MFEVSAIAGDICDVDADGICTSTNPNLALMIGTGGAVRDRGGWAIQDECARLIANERARSGKRYFPPGSAHLTTAGDLPFRGVIHCVASDAFHGTSVETIASCVNNAVSVAEKQGWTTLAMPLFGTGHVAFQPRAAAEAIVAALAACRGSVLQRVVLVARTAEQLEVIEGALARR